MADDRLTGLQETRTKIQRNPHVPDNAVFIEQPKDISTLIEDGKIVVIDDVRLPYDERFLLRIPSLPPTVSRRVKKAKLRDLCAPLHHEAYASGAHVLAELFGYCAPGTVTYDDADYFQKQIALVTNAMTALFAQLFPNYRQTGEVSHNWRLIETFAEGLHCDSYSGNDDEVVRIRLFYNYDEIPRIWNTTFDAMELARRYDMFLQDLSIHPNQINALLNASIPWHDLPRNLIFFAPRSLWIADTQINSHEIVYGRRCFSYTYSIDPDSLGDPEKRFQARMRRALSGLS